MSDLNKDFSNFRASDAATKPAFHVNSDWRRKQKENALINGDLEADENPDDSLSDGYWDPTPDPDEEENYELDENGNQRNSW